ncbi:beta-xylosidase [Mucilaginibacter limnophilus]|uniref:Beta-xylosidase n=1 Tax=Mucilaginibacter limnophilus TaxID=1932778 RepID=A0A437MXP0_9SPHI|nr:glycoside hydrolase family 43 protein [Mucilaginibacter limnophilus]RVU02432.1 beta-xylosidase [Mucilaginibacter limnophilus]
MKKILLTFFLGLILVSGYAQKKSTANDTIRLADPTIFYEKGTYYLYGTGSPRGFLVYTSTDMRHWSGPAGRREGHALLKGDAYGNHGFWAPQIYKQNGKYYMAYTADEHIAIAESDSPLGPFTQKEQKAISGPGKQIDPFIFKDKDGKLYLYHVRLQNGNRIFVSRLKNDLSDIDESTTIECISAVEPWENTANAPWPVSEGPTVVNHNGLYYLFYSANDFRNIDYAVGYATATSPLGPWMKYTANPIISRKNTGYNGTGHGDLFTGKDGKLYYVLHTHNSNTNTGRRKTAVIGVSFSKDTPSVFTADPKTFRFLLSSPLK